MSVTFYGRTANGIALRLDINHPAYVNMASGNARAFLSFLGIEPGNEPMGEVSVYEARRAVIKARAIFERRVGGFVRQGSDSKRPGQVRVIVGGRDEQYFDKRLRDFERFLSVVGEMGATMIWWA